MSDSLGEEIAKGLEEAKRNTSMIEAIQSGCIPLQEAEGKPLKKWLGCGNAAALLDVSLDAVCALADQGYITNRYTPKGRRLFKTSDLVKFKGCSIMVEAIADGLARRQLLITDCDMQVERKGNSTIVTRRPRTWWQWLRGE